MRKTGLFLALTNSVNKKKKYKENKKYKGKAKTKRNEEKYHFVFTCVFLTHTFRMHMYINNRSRQALLANLPHL